MDFLQLVHPEFRGAVAGQVEAGASGQATDQYEVKIVTRQGEDRWVHLGMTTVPVNGKPAGLGVAVDVTDRVRAEEAIRRRAERLAILREIDQAILAAGSPDAIAAAALRRIRRLVPCRRATVALFELEAGEASLLAVDDPGQPAVRAGSRVPLAELGELDDLRAGAVRQVEDVIAVQTFHRLQAEGLRSYIAAPLLSRGVLIGTLNLWRQSAGRFTSEEVEIAREIGTSLAVAIQHSRLFAEVVVAREELRALSGRLVEIQEAERRHVARELHDEIGQLLTGLRFSLDRDPGGDGLDAARRLTDDLIARVRELSLDLRPAMLDHLGLLPAIVWQIDRYSGQTGVRVAFEHRGLAGVRFAPELETAAYRVLQEALTNVARHAAVAEVRVRAWADPETLFIQIDDGGRGFDVGAPRAGSGVTGMQERARLLEGQVTIDSTPGAGTCVTAEFPLTGGRGAPEGRP
jgi:signal transduction histidine kinase